MTSHFINRLVIFVVFIILFKFLPDAVIRSVIRLAYSSEKGRFDKFYVSFAWIFKNFTRNSPGTIAVILQEL